jgi:cyclophilin family peptidyl-prolyl cis-trans isomerase
MLSGLAILAKTAFADDLPSAIANETDTNLRSSPRVTLKTTYGDITIELYPDKAPETVANFLKYVDDGHYNGTIFHRVIDGFMIQGGGFTADMQQKPTRAPIRNEADNGLKNMRGTISMARTPDPHSATAQFFINVVDNEFLDFRSPDYSGYGYCVFGKVVAGMDVVDKIKAVPTTTRFFHENVPVEPVIIQEAVRVEP